MLNGVCVFNQLEFRWQERTAKFALNVKLDFTITTVHQSQKNNSCEYHSCAQKILCATLSWYLFVPIALSGRFGIRGWSSP